MFRLRAFLLMLAPLTTLLLACGKSTASGSAACGLAAVAGPTTLLTEFGVPHQTLGEAPDQLPGRLVARIVAGPSLPAVVGRADSTWVIGLDGPVPPKAKPGFGVMVLDPAGRARGVMIYEGPPVEGAPPIGTVSVGAATIPLIGIQLDP